MLSELKKYVEQSIENMINNVHTAIPCEVVTYDPEKNEATLKPYGNFYTPYGDVVPYPEVTKVPFMFWQSIAQKSTIIYPINPGDECLLLFAERTLEQWKTKTGEVEVDLRFDLSNAFAIVGLFAKPNEHAKRAQENQSIIIQREKTFVEIYDGQIEMLVKDNEIDVNSYHAFIDGKTGVATLDVKSVEDDKDTINVKINGNEGKINFATTNTDEDVETFNGEIYGQKGTMEFTAKNIESDNITAKLEYSGDKGNISLEMFNYEKDIKTIRQKIDGKTSLIDLKMHNPDTGEETVSVDLNGLEGSADIEAKKDITVTSREGNITAETANGGIVVKSAKNITITASGVVTVNAQSMRISCDTEIYGNLNVGGDINASRNVKVGKELTAEGKVTSKDDFIAQDISLVNHTHTAAGETTTPPNQ